MSNLSQYQELRGKYSEIGSIDLRFEGQIVYRPLRAAPEAAAGGTPASEAGRADGSAEASPSAPPASGSPSHGSPIRPSAADGRADEPTARPESSATGATPTALDAGSLKPEPSDAGAGKKTSATHR